MGHTTYTHLNRQCRIVRPKEAIGQGGYLSMCALEHALELLGMHGDEGVEEERAPGHSREALQA